MTDKPIPSAASDRLTTAQIAAVLIAMVERGEALTAEQEIALRYFLAGKAPPIPSAAPSEGEEKYDRLETIARTLFKARSAGFSPSPHWEQEPNPLRAECWDDAADVAAALNALGHYVSPWRPAETEPRDSHGKLSRHERQGPRSTLHSRRHP